MAAASETGPGVAWRPLPIAREGYTIITGAAGITALLFWFGWPAAGGLAAALTAFVISFFRDPQRTAPAGEQYVLSPADGRVIVVQRVEERRFLDAPAVKISIFMSPLNVHVNRHPTSGTVERVQYNPGKYFRAFADKASLDNEQNAVVVRDPAGRRLCFVQIAGFVARRIVCYVRQGMSVRRGERCGMIMFGSRLDVFLPLEAAVLVTVGDRVRAGESVLAEWPA